MKSPLLLKWKTLLLGFFIFYLASYFVLSLRGEYVPAAIGGNGVKWYRWAPTGFVSGQFRMDQTTSNRALAIFYFPLWIIDMKFVHTSKSQIWALANQHHFR